MWVFTKYTISYIVSYVKWLYTHECNIYHLYSSIYSKLTVTHECCVLAMIEGTHQDFDFLFLQHFQVHSPSSIFITVISWSFQNDLQPYRMLPILYRGGGNCGIWFYVPHILSLIIYGTIHDKSTKLSFDVCFQVCLGGYTGWLHRKPSRDRLS